MSSYSHAHPQLSDRPEGSKQKDARTAIYGILSVNMLRLSIRDKTVLSGLYLSKFDHLGVKRLGFEGFTEAFNVIGLALGARPASIKNYRDEFDPLFANPRK